MSKKIVIGSVLKPVNDARMYEKIAISLSRVPELKVHVAGFKSSSASGSSTIIPHPLFDFHRLSFNRILAPWKFYKLLLQVKPQVVIITTHELLIVTVIYKILFGGRIIYDVQENYFRNILYGNSFPPFIKHLMAPFVRLKELLTRPFIDHYLLAERNYEQEFSFTKGKSTVLENKVRKPQNLIPRQLPETTIRLLYSGTIAETYGVFEAIDLAQALHEVEPKITLTIIGYSSKKETLTNIKERIKKLPFIHLEGGDQLVPHTEILKEIEKADFGLLPYPPNKSTDNCIPTKLFEYLAYRLPMLVRNNPLWTEIIDHYQAGLSINFKTVNPDILLAEMQSGKFYSTKPGDEIYWESHEERLREIVRGA